MTLRHVVAWKLAADDESTRVAQAREIADRLRALVGVIPSIGTMTVGPNIIEGNWDVALVAERPPSTSSPRRSRSLDRSTP